MKINHKMMLVAALTFVMASFGASAQKYFDYKESRLATADWYQIKGRVKEDLFKFIVSKTKRKPMVLPIIMNA